MKYKFLLMSFLILMSCHDRKRISRPAYENMDSVDMKKLMNEKMAEQTQLTHQIDSIQQRIEELSPSADNKRTSRVTDFTVKDTVFLHYYTLQGLLDAQEKIGINADVNGRIVRLNIEEGDYVGKGDLVAELDMDQLTKQRDELLTGYRSEERRVGKEGRVEV